MRNEYFCIFMTLKKGANEQRLRNFFFRFINIYRVDPAEGAI